MSDYSDRFTAVLDACVLGGALKRNILLSLAEAGLFRPKWSAAILDEAERAITRISNGTADSTRQCGNMESAFPEALVTGFDPLIEGLSLPDPDDRHVLAAAINTGAHVIVTDNLVDFPNASLVSFGIEAMSADDFIADCIDLDPGGAMTALRRMRQRFEKPQMDAAALIREIERQGLLQTATLLSGFEDLI